MHSAYECSGENFAFVIDQKHPNQIFIILSWNLETLTGIWGIFTNEASGQEAHEDSWRKEVKWKATKWIMASL